MRSSLIPAAALICLVATGCTPAVGLKQNAELTVTQVTRLRALDACRLASTRKPTPKARVTTVERTVERTVGHTRIWLEFGRATVRLQRGPQLRKLQEILRRFYRGVPATMLTSPVVMELDFTRRPLGNLLVRRDHDIIVRIGTATFHLAYHPCVSELLFAPPAPVRERSRLSEKLHRFL